MFHLYVDMMIDDFQWTAYRVLVLSNDCCLSLCASQAVALVGGRVSGYIDTISELIGSGNRRL